jgi:glycosyltransferase involved in cell wall biosynthesis
MVGHLKAWKGQGLVLEAMLRLEASVRERLQVLFVGSAPAGERDYRDSLEATICSQGLAGCARLLGQRDDVAELMNASDLVLHASTLPEPFGLVVVEGMSLGKPVLASRLGGPSEIFSNGDGLTFDPASPDDLARQLTRLVEVPELRATIGSAARERARTFGVESTAEQVQSVYASLLESP